MARIAVITGDLINSTKVSNPKAFREKLSKLMDLMSHRFDATTNLYRGDGFQVALDATRFNALEAAVIIRTGLIANSPDKNNKWDARIALAFDIGVLSTSDQNSKAFVNSGHTLDAMKKDHFCVHAEDEVSKLALGVATSFADNIINNLTPTEAEVLHYYFLYRENHADIARRLGKKRPTITIALQRGRYLLIDRYVRDMDEFLKQRHG